MAGDVDTSGPCISHDGLSKGVLRIRFGSGYYPKEPVGVHIRVDPVNLRGSLGHGPGLVQDDSVYPGGGLQRGCCLEQYPVAGSVSGTHDYSQGCGQSEGART